MQRALRQEPTVTGEVSAERHASISGTDSDIVVKPIDMFQEQPPGTGAENALSEGSTPRDYAASADGHRLPIAKMVRRPCPALRP